MKNSQWLTLAWAATAVVAGAIEAQLIGTAFWLSFAVANCAYFGGVFQVLAQRARDEEGGGGEGGR